MPDIIPCYIPRMLIETHCHLYSPPLADDVAGVLQRADAAGVRAVIVPAYDVASWDDTARLAAAHPGVHAALGLHPWVADQPLDLATLAARLASSRAVAVGEIGLDTKIASPDLAVQIAALTLQLDLAHDLGLPVILHCRGAFEELAGLLARYTPRLRGVLHAFSRGPELAARFLDLGLHLGLGGAITRPHAERVRRVAARVALDRVVLETDAPSIGLHELEAVRTEPCHVREVAMALAGLRGEALDDVAAATTTSARALFGI
jgi:TatD DNase family protein